MLFPELLEAITSKVPWNIILNTFQVLLKGMVVTVEVAVGALFLGIVLGLVLGLGRVYGGSLVSKVIAIFVLILRALPPVLTIFILFYAVTSIINLPPLLAGILSLGLSSGAFQAEIFRCAILGVPDGQMISARALGMTKGEAIRTIIIPQAFRLAIPSWSNEAALVIKNSSLVYVLGIPDMMRQAQYAAARTAEPFLIFSLTALAYYLLILLANKGLSALDQKFRIPTLELEL